MGADGKPHRNSPDLDASPRMGVLVCECGDEIASVLDTNALCSTAANLPGVVYASCEAYPCSKDGLLRMQQAITENKLERLLVAGCTPRLVENHFREAAFSAGLEAGGVEVVDIREHCAYVHAHDPDVMQKAADLIAMGVSRLAATSLPFSHTHTLVNSALILGSGLSGLTVANYLANAGHHVTLVESAQELGGTSHSFQENAKDMIDGLIEIVSNHPGIDVLLDSRLTQVAGPPGAYEVSITSRDQDKTLTVGAIVVATGAKPLPLDSSRYFDPLRVVTQAHFAHELAGAASTGSEWAVQDLVLILSSEDGDEDYGSHLSNLTGVRQAIQVKQLNPSANVTVLFRELYSAGDNHHLEERIQQAKELGVTFFRYRAETPPLISEKTVDVDDPLTGQPVRLVYDRVVLAMPLVPQDNSDTLAALLSLLQDKHGFILEARTRLVPGRYCDTGIYVVGSAHQPVDTTDALLQAYITSSRLQRYLRQDSLSTSAPVAEIAQETCTGCGNCVPVCPVNAIQLIQKDGVLSLAEVESLRCTGCGNCAVVCPVNAIMIPGWDDLAIVSQINAAFNSSRTKDEAEGVGHPPRILAFACEWSAYASADLAGTLRLPYPSDIRILRMNCSARFDPQHILWALLNNADGVLLGACHPGECHYGSGNLYAEERVKVLKQQLADYGLDPRRVRLEFLAGDDGQGFVETITSFRDDLGKKMVKP
jgi:heterodisulfide reductase subunit A